MGHRSSRRDQKGDGCRVKRIALALTLLSGCAIATSAGDFTDFDLSWTGQPADLSVASAPGVVTCDITFDDTETISYAGCVLSNPNAADDASCLDTTPVGDLWSCDAIIPQDGADGDWTVKYAFVTAATGTPYFAYTDDLAGNDPVLPTVVPVDSPSQDITPPTLSTFARTSPVTLGHSTTCTITATDANGIQDAGCTWGNSAGDVATCIAHSGAGNDWACPAPVKGDAAAGTWTVRDVFARDTKGNLTKYLTGSVPGPTTMTVEGSGIASAYPGDVGIGAHQDVIFFEDFEDVDIPTMTAAWDDVEAQSLMSFSTPPAGSVADSQSVQMLYPGGSGTEAVHLFKNFANQQNATYVRYYVKYNASSNYHHVGMWMGGYNPATAWPQGTAGQTPDGADFFHNALETFNNTLFLDNYAHWPDMGCWQPDPSCYGNDMMNGIRPPVSTGAWNCVELMLKPNTAGLSNYDGEFVVWVDDELIQHLEEGSPLMTKYSNDSWGPDPAGTAFPGFNWRSTSNLGVNWSWPQLFVDTGPSSVVFDQIVVASSRIGCMDPIAVGDGGVGGSGGTAGTGGTAGAGGTGGTGGTAGGGGVGGAPYYSENFDTWPDGGCSSPYTACGGASIEGLYGGQVDVQAFTACRSGKCWKGTWTANEVEARFKPEDGFQVPAYDTFFGRIYIRFASNFSEGVPYNFKINRLISNVGGELDIVTWGNEFVMNNTNNCGDCDYGDGGILCRVPFNPQNHIGEWVKLEWYWKHNSSASNHDGECRLWATYEDDSVDSDSSLNLKLLPDPQGIDRSAWIFANVSNFGQWPYALNKTIYMDDVCIDGDRTARTGVCAD